MLKTLKWIYRLGVMHERQRVRHIIAAHRHDKPDFSYFGEDRQDDYKQSLELWFAVENELQKLLEPTYTQQIRKTPLDDEVFNA